MEDSSGTDGPPDCKDNEECEQPSECEHPSECGEHTPACDTPQKADNDTDDETTRRELEYKLRRSEQPLDYSPSSTAVDPRDAAQDVSESIQTGRHGYTENATFTAEDLPAKSDRWQTLNQANRDYYADEETDIKAAQLAYDHRNDVRAWGLQIGLTDHEIERAVVFLGSREEGWAENFGMETMILGALTLAANEGAETEHTEAKQIRPTQALSENWPECRDAYATLRDDLDVNPADVRSVRERLRSSAPL